MTFNLKGVGIDCVDIVRFEKFKDKSKHLFLKKVFFENELKHCFSYKSPASHLAGIFAAKEAVSKALGTRLFPFVEIEIRHEKSGSPIAYKKGKKLPVKVSITHTNIIACAIAVA